MKIRCFVAVMLVFCGCSDSQFARYQEAFRANLINGTTDRSCGTFPNTLLVQDCPIESVCFTSACEAHDNCYSTCGVSRTACDITFYADLVSICLESVPLDDPNIGTCLSFASVYWSAVDQFGQEPFDDVQTRLGCQPGEGEVTLGSCCTAGSPPVCRDVESAEWCAEDSVFVPGLTCERIEAVLGGCPRPTNDACADRRIVCPHLTREPDIGFCSRGSENEVPSRVCSISSQDCFLEETCVPYAADAFRCSVSADNRLASTDGPGAGGDCVESGEQSFQADVWFEYVAACSGTLYVDLCAGTIYDSMLAVYGPGAESSACVCPTDDSTLLGCNDDFCASFNSPSAVTVQDVVEGGCYLIRVGGWSGSGTDVDARRGISRLDIGLLCYGSDRPL